MPDPVTIEPFTISVEPAVLADLRDRIRRTRWPHEVPGTGWEAGADAGYLRSLLHSWADGFEDNIARLTQGPRTGQVLTAPAPEPGVGWP